MNPIKTTDQLIGRLKKHYFGHIIVLAILLIIILFHIIILFPDPHPVSVTAERYILLLTFIAVPAVLKWYAVQIKKLPLLADKTDKADEVGQVGEVGEVGEVGKVGEVGEVGEVGKVGEVSEVDEVSEVGEVGEVSEVNQGRIRKRYQLLWMIRLFILSALTLLHILLYAYSRNKNFFWLSLVLLIFFMFCKPSAQEVTGGNKES